MEVYFTYITSDAFKLGYILQGNARATCYQLSGTIIRGTLKAPNSQLVTPISIKLQRPDGYD
jgi:hypothetical protein